MRIVQKKIIWGNNGLNVPKCVERHRFSGSRISENPKQNKQTKQKISQHIKVKVTNIKDTEKAPRDNTLHKRDK